MGNLLFGRFDTWLPKGMKSNSYAMDAFSFVVVELLNF